MHLMDLQGYTGPRTKGYKTSLTNSGCKWGGGFRLSQQCSSGRASKRKGACTTHWDWEITCGTQGRWKYTLQTAPCRDLAAQHKGQLSEPNPADQNTGGPGPKWSQLLIKPGAGARRFQGESFTKSVHTRVQFILYNPLFFILDLIKLRN